MYILNITKRHGTGKEHCIITMLNTEISSIQIDNSNIVFSGTGVFAFRLGQLQSKSITVDYKGTMVSLICLVLSSTQRQHLLVNIACFLSCFFILNSHDPCLCRLKIQTLSFKLCLTLEAASKKFWRMLVFNAK